MTVKPRLLILGAGGHGCSVAEAADLSGLFNVVGYLDDGLATGALVLGVPVLGALQTVGLHSAAFDKVIVAIGNNKRRQELVRQLLESGFVLANVVHPCAFVSPSAELGVGCAVMAGAIVGTQARLGVGAIVNCGAIVDHHAVVEDFGHLGVHSAMAGGTRLGSCAWLQAGSAVGYGVQVPADTVVQPGCGLS